MNDRNTSTTRFIEAISAESTRKRHDEPYGELSDLTAVQVNEDICKNKEILKALPALLMWKNEVRGCIIAHYRESKDKYSAWLDEMMHCCSMLRGRFESLEELNRRTEENLNNSLRSLPPLSDIFFGGLSVKLSSEVVFSKVCTFGLFTSSIVF